jgi:hypothetical protein
VEDGLSDVVAAAVNYDGGLRGSVATTGPRGTPFLFMHHDGAWQPASDGDPGKQIEDAQLAAMRAMYASVAGPAFDYTVIGSEHSTFSDGERMIPTLDQTVVHAQQEGIVALTVAFFDDFLRHEQGAALPDVAKPFPSLSDTKPTK